MMGVYMEISVWDEDLWAAEGSSDAHNLQTESLLKVSRGVSTVSVDSNPPEMFEYLINIDH